jgi:hypothetical protein
MPAPQLIKMLWDWPENQSLFCFFPMGIAGDLAQTL